MKNKLFLAAAVVGLAACTATAESPKYEVSVPAPDIEDGTIAYLVDFDTSENMDSTVVENNVATFRGTLQNPTLVRMIIDGNRYSMFVVESGTITFSADGHATGTPVNEAMLRFFQQTKAASDSLKALGENPDPAAAERIYTSYNEMSDSTMEANINNPFGYYLFLQKAYDLDREELTAAIEKYPRLKGYKRINKVFEVFDRKDATAPGKKFTDFEVTYDGKTYRLSDYVGKGNYTLVDFWASWCGPCRREAEVIKQIYADYAPKGLDVVGVAVWDEPENTLEAIDALQLPWKQVINAQTIPTDIYGILGIPCIILFAPDGTIVSRDLQGDALKAAVAEAIDGVTAATEDASAEE